MHAGILKDFYTRDIQRFIEEITLFKNEDDLWKTAGAINNSAGNLALHIIGGSNYLIGTLLANTGYVRNRNEEFTQKNIPKETIIKQLEVLIPLVRQTLSSVDLNAEYPILFDDKKCNNMYVLTQLLLHLNYHLGQVNYLRRMLQ